MQNPRLRRRTCMPYVSADLAGPLTAALREEQACPTNGCIRFSVAQKELRMWQTLTIARFSALSAGLADGNSAERQATGKPLDLRSLFPLPLIAECTPAIVPA